MVAVFERKDSIVAEFEALRAEVLKPEKPCPFLDKIPVEIRLKIYRHLLVPPPAPRVECSASARDGRLCSPGGRLFSSTCKPKPSTLRSVGCTSCKHRGEDVHTAILRTNKQIFGEAIEVLYENVVAVHRVGNKMISSSQVLRWAPDGIPAYARQYVKHLHLAIESEHRGVNTHIHNPIDNWDEHIKRVCWVMSQCMLNIKVLSIHIDFDLTTFNEIQNFGMLSALAQFDVDFVVDIHVLRSWSAGSQGWHELVSSRDGHEDTAALVDEWAAEMRKQMIWVLKDGADQLGKKLVIREA